MAVRILLWTLWVFAAAALAGALMLPGTLDIYIEDRYLPIQRVQLILVICLLFVLPLLVLTVWHFRSRHA